MERRQVINGDLERVLFTVRETVRRRGFHFERVVEDQSTFDRARIFSKIDGQGGVVLLEDPTGNTLSKLIASDEIVEDVVYDLSKVNLILEPRAF